VRIGLEKDDLFDRLQADIERAREFYRRRVAPDLPDSERIFGFALVDVLVGNQRKVSTSIW
jgi:catechol 2,3-dioxygenase-like lactoylglutathione lyase family enzyme